MQPASEQLPLVLGFSSCDGTEAALTDCPEFAFGPGLEECTEFDNVYVHCFSGPDPGAVRDEVSQMHPFPGICLIPLSETGHGGYSFPA